MRFFKVEIKDNNTAYASFRCDDPGHECSSSCGPTTETKQTFYFKEEKDALEFYEGRKASLRFAGTAGLYVTYPCAVEDNAEDVECAMCGEFVSLEKALWLDGIQHWACSEAHKKEWKINEQEIEAENAHWARVNGR